MAFRLENNQSIPPLENFKINLPDFTILTGVNGAGKTRLLDAIKNGKIQAFDSSGTAINLQEIDIIKNPSGFNPFSENSVEEFSLQRILNQSNIKSSIGVKLNDYYKNYQLPPSSLKGLLPEMVASKKRYEASKSLYEKLKEAVKSEEFQEELELPVRKILDAAINACKVLSSRGFEINVSDIPYLVCPDYVRDNNTIPKIQILAPDSFALSRLFENWRRKFAENEYNKYLEKSRGIQKDTLTDLEFETIYGKKPWIEVNELLQKIESPLQFHVDEEQLYEINSAFPELTLKDQKENLFKATGISTGERIIFSIAVRRYAHLSPGIRYSKKKLLLLDELDAHLHPSLCGQLLELIQETLVDQGTKVILSTHCASTVAQSPEGNLVILAPYERPVAASRREAMNVLLSGQEKFFIDLSGSRIVFVEDQTDVVIFESISSLITDDASAVRLDFKSISQKNSAGRTNGGKDSVKKLVADFGENRNFRGLVDYDLTEKSSKYLQVLCEGERYGIENLLLDPRILAFILLRHNTEKWARCFDVGISYPLQYMSLPNDDVQKCMMKVEEIIFKKPPTNFIGIEYKDGKTFNVSTKLLEKNCHELHDLVEKALKLENKSVGGNTLEWIAKQILAEIDGCIPKSMITTFNAICL